MEGPPPSLPPPPQFNGLPPRVLAPYIYGIVLQFGMWCIVLTQATTFYTRQGRTFQDPVAFRCFIACLLAAVTAQTGVGLTRLYELAIPSFPHRMLTGIVIDPALNCIVLTVVHTFYVHRCYKLSGSRIVLGVLSILVLAQAAGCIALLVYACIPVLRMKSHTWLFILTSITLALDACISGVLIFGLVKHRTGVRQVDAVLVRVIRLTVQSFLPCVFIVILILVGSIDRKLVGMLDFALTPMGQFYATAIMSTLNSRASLRRDIDGRRGQGGRVSIHTDLNIPSPVAPSSGQPRNTIRRPELASMSELTGTTTVSTDPTISTTDPTIGNSISPMCEVHGGRVTWHAGPRHCDVDLESLRDPSRTLPEKREYDM